MMRLSNRAELLQESAIRKLNSTVVQQNNVLFYKLNIGQPDVPTPQPMLTAIKNWHKKVIAYGPASGTHACRQAFANYHSKWQSQLTSEHIAVITGGSEALLFAFTAICDQEMKCWFQHFIPTIMVSPLLLVLPSNPYQHR